MQAISPILSIHWRCLNRYHKLQSNEFVARIQSICVTMATMLENKLSMEALTMQMDSFRNFYEKNTELQVDGVSVLLILRVLCRRPDLLEFFVADCIFDKLRNVCTCLQQQSNINLSWTPIVSAKVVKMPTYTVFTTKELICNTFWWPDVSNSLFIDQ